ncbi:ABC transporter substrate-binding protein [Paenibacillus physcomitrellae]|uniref:ABC transporter substrate-binding protein n=1 Tax=Paenibacillus physcomitrellae TaxID=1619311 RepID=A0ABQ1FXB1_9BACL|nr:ABC transporter substrate-binding protein [Paenibacillus physcomitrellae]GGA31500.1 ABC transporter substrate-binding protein [Paenibacillus physcomitrellae]
MERTEGYEVQVNNRVRRAFKLGSLLLATVLTVAGCSSSGSGEAGTAGGTKTIHIFQFKVEIADALDKLKADYEKEHPGIKLDIQTVGGGSDYGASLKAKFASGSKPDIFNVGGYVERDMWFDYLEDLSDQPWVKDVKDVAREPMTRDGKLYGMPMNLEGYGFMYNKDLFAKAGITKLPMTIDELEEACKKLQAIGVTPFANGYQEWFVLGNHNVNVAFAQQKAPGAFIQGLTDGTEKFAGNQVFEEWANLLDLTLKYGNKNPLSTDYNTQVTMFASGQAAMMQQGNWTQVQLDGINPDLKLGFLPMPIDNTPEDNDKLYVGVPNNWVIDKESPVKQEAKDFLNWLVTSDTGKKYITKEFKFIPAFNSIKGTEEDLGPLGAEILKYTDAGKTLTWNWARMPNGMPQELANTMQAYIGGKIDKQEMFEQFQTNWDNLSVQ